jgi:hypothetical protein
VQAASGVIAGYLADMANEEQGADPEAFDSIQSTQFVVDDIRFTTAEDGTRLAVAQAHFVGGGPSTTVTLHYSHGQVWHYSAMFLIASLLLLIIHIPLLDRAERTRKEFLVGGSAPPWYGPA